MAVAAGLLAAATPRAHGDQPGNVIAVPDSVRLTPQYKFSPLYTNKIDGSVSYVGMVNKFNTGIVTPYGPTFDFSISKEEKHYRLQDRREANKQLSLSGLYAISPGFTSSIGVSDSRVFNRSAAVGGSFQDFIINDQAMNATMNYARTHNDVRVDWAAQGSVVNGERIFKTDETVGGGVNGGLGYTLFDGRVKVQARGALRETSETSRTTLREFGGLGASEDSVSSVVRVAVADSIDVRVTWASFNGDRRFADQAQGALGGQLGGVENVFQETEMRNSRATGIALNSQIWRGFVIKVSATHEEQLFDYAVQRTRFSETVGDAVSGSISYTMPWRTTSVVQFENRETLRNFGPQSVASFNETRKRASIALQHSFKPTFRVDFNATTQISQSFYVKYDENPRDRDQLDTSANLKIASEPFKKVSADITLGYTSTQFINIDASQSRSNRTRDLYELRPGYTYRINDRLSVSQTYGLLIEFSDYVFTAEDNFLDRNITLNNVVTYKPTRRLMTRMDYGLYVHDKGSYLPVGPNGEELLDVEREDRRDRMVLRVNYNMTKNVDVFAENTYSRFRDRTVSSGQETLSTDGSVQVGTSGVYDWGNNRKLRFMLTRVKRFSPFGSELEKDYWDMRSELNFPL